MALPDVLKVSFEFSPKLGVRELPELSARKESSVPGVYVVGDLADAPIIKVALNQGYDVAAKIVEELGVGAPDGSRASRASEVGDLLDVVVVGAGPAGIGAGLLLQEKGARYVIVERERPFATIQNFPKRKLIFSEPRDLLTRGDLWFGDATKEDLVDRWERALDGKDLVIHQPEEVVDIKRVGEVLEVHTRVGARGLMDRPASDPTAPTGSEGATNVYRARRVILAIGRRAAMARLEVPGEDLDKVRYALRDPADHAGRRVLVVGGGDSAVEAACACAEAGAVVTMSYRKDAFSRSKAKNRKRIDGLIAAGRIRVEYRTTPIEIREEVVVLERGRERIEVPNDDVLVCIGTRLPRGFLSRIGIRMNGDMDLLRAAWIASFAVLTYCFYVLKSGADCVGGTVAGALCEGGSWVAKKAFFPFGPGHPLESVPGLLKVDLGFRVVDGGFWGTVCYSALIVIFGVLAYRRYPSDHQRRRYLSLIGFQAVFLFGIPELIAPLIIERPWKVYALTVPWPLSIWSLVDAPSWAGGSTGTAVSWLLAGALVSFVAIPAFVYRNGERFCSWFCGCGGLAETLGDRWRQHAPRGRTALQAEWAGRLVLAAAIPVTLLILNDAWGFVAQGALYETKAFAQHWYGLMVDFWLACVVGVAFYPYLGNRVWCRFFCPLRAYMELLSRWFSRIQISANDKCIGCGECTRYCQMGIDVQAFAQRQEDFHNGNSACIQCGICIEVCPMSVLEISDRGVRAQV